MELAFASVNEMAILNTVVGALKHLSTQREAETSDESLMIRYGEGDFTAFDQLYHRHKDALYRFTLRQCANEQHTEELCQDIWIKVTKARHRYTPSAKWSTWFYRIAHNRLIDHYRRQSGATFVSFEQGPDIPSNLSSINELPGPEKTADLECQTQKLLKLIYALPEAQREVLLMRQETDLTLAQIAEVVGTNRETVKSRLRYALKAIRTEFEYDDE